MQITIQEKKDNQLLDRVEVKGDVSFDKVTPTNKEIAQVVAKETNGDESLTVVKGIHTTFGKKAAHFTAYSYKTQDAKAKAERSTKHIRKQEEVAAKKAQEEKQAAAEAKKAEEEAKAAEKAKAAEPKEEEKEGEA